MEVRKNESGLKATLHYLGRVNHLPFGIFDGDAYQLFCLFSPNFEKHIDADP